MLIELQRLNFIKKGKTLRLSLFPEAFVSIEKPSKSRKLFFD